MKNLAIIAGLLALVASPAFGQYSPTSVGQGVMTDCTLKIASTGTPQQVLAQSGTPGAAQGNRVKLYLQNTSVGKTMGVSFTLTNTLSFASSQAFVLTGVNSPGTNMIITGSEFVPMNSVWVVGTTNDVLACAVAGTP